MDRISPLLETIGALIFFAYIAIDRYVGTPPRWRRTAPLVFPFTAAVVEAISLWHMVIAHKQGLQLDHYSLHYLGVIVTIVLFSFFFLAELSLLLGSKKKKSYQG